MESYGWYISVKDGQFWFGPYHTEEQAKHRLKIHERIWPEKYTKVIVSPDIQDAE